MRIILDGLSGVGKSYLGELLSETLNIPFIPYLPDFQENEVSIHKSLISKHNQLDNVILEGSLYMSNIVKGFMFDKGYISFNELLECVSVNKDYINKGDIMFYITDNYDNILNRRSNRGREFEFNKLMSGVDLIMLDKYIDEVIKLKNYHKYSGCVIDRSQFKDEYELVNYMVKCIKNIAINYTLI